MTTKDEGSNPGGEGQPAGNNQPDHSEMLKRLEAAEATNKRLLEESKGYKEKLKQFTSQVDENEKKIALEKGDLQKLLDMARKEAETVKADNQKLRESVLKGAVKSVVAKVAGDVHDIDDLLNQPQYSHILKEALDGENLTVDETKAKSYVEAVLKDKPWLKKTPGVAGVVTKKPGASSGQKSISELSTEDLKKLYLSGAFKQ